MDTTAPAHISDDQLEAVTGGTAAVPVAKPGGTATTKLPDVVEHRDGSDPSVKKVGKP